MNYFINTHLTLFAVCLVIAASAFSFLLLMMKKNQKETPHDSLQKKLSVGEIDNYEYEQRKRLLQRDEDLKIKTFFLSRM